MFHKEDSPSDLLEAVFLFLIIIKVSFKKQNANKFFWCVCMLETN